MTMIMVFQNITLAPIAHLSNCLHELSSADFYQT